MQPPAAPPIQVPQSCLRDPDPEPGARAFKGVDAYQDTIAGVKSALSDVVQDWNDFLSIYVAPLRAKESSCRAGLKAQVQ